MSQGVPAYRRHGREFSMLNPASLAGVTLWTLEKGAEELKCAMRGPVIGSQPVARGFEMENGEIVPATVPVPAREATEVSEEKHAPSLTVELRDLPNFEGWMCLDLKVILKTS